MEDLRRRREFYNTQVNRYARDHSTNVMAHPKPGGAYTKCRVLARAVIYQALKDAVEDREQHVRMKFELLNDPEWALIGDYRYPGYINDDRVHIQTPIQVLKFKNRYGGQRIWTSAPPESVQFFTSPDYQFYAEIAGIDMSGTHLLKQFTEKHRQRKKRPASVDELMDA